MKGVNNLSEIEKFISDIDYQIFFLESKMPSAETSTHDHLMISIYNDTLFSTSRIMNIHYEKKLYKTGFKWVYYKYEFFE